MRALRHFKVITMAAAMAVGAAGAFAQVVEDAQIPFKVNVNAKVTARQGETAVSADVMANVEKTLTVPLGGVSVWWKGGGAQGRLNAPAITASRGNITLRLPAQAYKNAEIALYSVNGKQILRGRATASETAANVARRNVAAGTYLLSVKGINGSALATRLTHSGGNLSVNATFGAENASPVRQLGKAAAAGDWRITVSALGYKDSVYTLNLRSGQNDLQNINLAELSNAVAVRFNNGSAPVIEPENFRSNVTITGEHVVINMPLGPTIYNVIASGTTQNGSIKIYNQFNMGLHLNGVNITNPKGPAINIQNPGSSAARPVTVNVADGYGTNYLADGAVYEGITAGEDAKGTFFSERRVTFSGSGLLEVRSKGGHAIVVDNDVTFDNVNIKIPEALRDGIHANDSIVINGGTLDITSKGEAVQNENPGKAVIISDAKITANTTDPKSHGISSEGIIEISGGSADSIKLYITGNGSKGIRSRGNMRVSGGYVYVNASGDRHIDNTVTPRDTSNVAGIKVEGNMLITGGKIILECTKPNGNGKGINVNGHLTISGGDITARADGDGIKVDGNLVITGGTTYARSARTQDLDIGGTNSVANPTMLDGAIGGRK